MGLLINLIIWLVIFCVLYFVVMKILGLVGAPAPAVQIAQVLFLLVALIFVLGLFVGYTPGIYGRPTFRSALLVPVERAA